MRRFQADSTHSAWLLATFSRSMAGAPTVRSNMIGIPSPIYTSTEAVKRARASERASNAVPASTYGIHMTEAIGKLSAQIAYRLFVYFALQACSSYRSTVCMNSREISDS